MPDANDSDSSTLDLLREEKLRETRVRTDLLGLQHKQQTGEVINVEQAKAMIASTFGPLRQALLALPSTMAARCNPADPVMAREALGEWVDGVLKTVRAKVEPAAQARKRGAPRKPQSRSPEL